MKNQLLLLLPALILMCLWPLTSSEELLSKASLVIESNGETRALSTLPVTFQYGSAKEDSGSFSQLRITPAQPMDFRSVTAVSLTMDSGSTGHFTMTIHTEEESGTRPISKGIHIVNDEREMSIPLTLFRTPNYWSLMNSMDNSAPSLNKISAVTIESYHSFRPGKESVIHLRSLSVTRNRQGFLYGSLALFLLWGGIGITGIYRSRVRAVTYIPQEIQDSSREKAVRIMAILTEEFSDKELTLRRVADSSGISMRQISGILQEQEKGTFKQVLNRIRLTKAEELLKETGLPLSGIYQRCGYRTRTHFHRLFKEHTDCTPEEFRSREAQDE